MCDTLLWKNNKMGVITVAMHNRLLQVAVSTQPAKVACGYGIILHNEAAAGSEVEKVYKFFFIEIKNATTFGFE